MSVLIEDNESQMHGLNLFLRVLFDYSNEVLILFLSARSCYLPVFICCYLSVTRVRATAVWPEVAYSGMQ